MADSNSATGGIGFFGILTVLFIGLKLGGIIEWGWLWVLSPLWISVGLGIAVLLIILAIVGPAAFKQE